MANKDSVVDISSNTQVFKLYNKKGRVRRILCLVFSILFLLGGSGFELCAQGRGTQTLRFCNSV